MLRRQIYVGWRYLDFKRSSHKILLQRRISFGSEMKYYHFHLTICDIKVSENGGKEIHPLENVEIRE